MSIEEQIAALEARLQQCLNAIALAESGAAQAAERAEAAAARAELAALTSSQAEVVSVQAAESAQVAEIVAVQAAEIAVIEEEQTEQNREEEEEDGREQEEPEISVPDGPGDGQEVENGKSELQPITIKVEEPHHREPTLFKPNHTRFARGRKS